MIPRSICVRTPGKLILSGEHAVVHGNPAIGIAVNRYMDVTLTRYPFLKLSFNLMSIDFQRQFTLGALRKLKSKINKHYKAFSDGKKRISDVLEHPFELALFTAINVIDSFKQHLPNGLDIATHSTIPVGCGMGSSAASVVSLIHALSKILNMDLPLERYIELGIESENLQHGRSSGFDIHITHQGGCLYFDGDRYDALDFPTHWPIHLIHTGKPSTGTGETVAHAKPFITQERLQAFARVTNTLRSAITNNNLESAQRALRENHHLLREIQVVPNHVNHFIEACRDIGLSGKICGAGCHQGDHAGMLILLGDANKEALQKLCDEHAFQYLPVQIDERGSHVVSS